MRARLVLLCLAFLATSCTSDAPQARPTPSSTSVSPSAGLVVAVARGKQGVSLYRVGRDRRPVLLETLPVPPKPQGSPYTYGAWSIALSAGPRPLTCVAWQAQDTDAISGFLRCYPFGDTTGFAVEDANEPTAAVVSAQGGSLAWESQVDEGGNEWNLSTATVDGAGLSGVHTYPTARRAGGEPFGCIDAGDGSSASHPRSFAWLDDRRLLLQCSEIDGIPGELLVMDPSTRRAEPLDVAHQAPYDAFVLQGITASGDLLGTEEVVCDPACGPTQQRYGDRAVLVSRATHKVVLVIATPLPGRDVGAVSGGSGGYVYTTALQGDPEAPDQRTYLRLPGDTKGVPLAGLPADARFVVAQP